MARRNSPASSPPSPPRSTRPARRIAARSTKLARFLLDTGCDGLNVLGTTGEATSFSLEQRKAVMSDYKKAGLPLDRLMVGTGAAATADAVALTRHAAELGFAGALMLPPFYYKGVPDDGLAAYIDAIVKATAEQADPDLSLSLPVAVGPALARQADRAAARGASGPHRRAEGFLRRHGLCARGGRRREGLRRVPLDRGLPDRGARAAIFAGCISATANLNADLCQRAWQAATRPRSSAR